LTAKEELGKIFEMPAEEAIKAGKNTVAPMETFTRDTVQQVRGERRGRAEDRPQGCRRHHQGWR
jgi:hypothetical protein